jgi:hypothetical protein
VGECKPNIANGGTPANIATLPYGGSKEVGYQNLSIKAFHFIIMGTNADIFLMQ